MSSLLPSQLLLFRDLLAAALCCNYANVIMLVRCAISSMCT